MFKTLKIQKGKFFMRLSYEYLFKVVHSVHGIMFKDLKQILRKEQCDASILLTANVPAAKKIVVHGPRKSSFVLFLLFLQY